MTTDRPTETRSEHRERWILEIRRELFRWHRGEACNLCGEWVGHWGGSTDREPCSVIPLNLPLQEVRPNCNTVHRHWIGDAIRAACEKRGVQ
jgi:hypothetical protein